MSNFATASNIRKIVLLPMALALVWLGVSSASAEWDVVTYRGRSYVSTEDLARFYGFKHERAGNNFTLRRKGIEIRGRRGSKAITINRLKIYLSYSALAWGKRTIVSVFDVTHTVDAVLRPPRQKVGRDLKTVVIDAAHGGSEEGVRSKKFGNEKVHTLAVAKTLAAELGKRRYATVLTREADVTMTADERVGVANTVDGESIFISLHINTDTKRNSSGMETYTLAPAGTPATYDPDGTKPNLNYYLGNLYEGENSALATALHGSLVVGTGASDLGIKRARFRELRGVRMPGAVVRLGYLTSPAEGAKLADPGYQAKLAGAIADGIDRYAGYLRAGAAQTEGEEDPVLTLEDVAASKGATKVEHVLRARITAGEGAEIDPAKIDVEVYFIDLVNGEFLEPSAAEPPRIRWVSVLPDWTEHRTEELEVTLQHSFLTPEERKVLGNRAYFGFVVRLLYDGVEQAVEGSPPQLERCLYQFYSLGGE